MKVLVTGSTGFIGKNLCEKIESSGQVYELYRANSKTSNTELAKCLEKCDILYNLAAVHRPADSEDFNRINVNYFREMLEHLKAYNPSCSVVTMSSVHSGNGSLYGNSKKEAENLLKRYGDDTKSPVHLLRLTNCFGKYAQPNAHSVVATFCYNISHDLPIRIDNPEAPIKLCYIDDVVDLLVSFMNLNESSSGYIPEELIYPVTVGYIAESLMQFRNDCEVGQNDFLDRLRTTYNWYAQQ